MDDWPELPVDYHRIGLANMGKFELLKTIYKAAENYAVSAVKSRKELLRVEQIHKYFMKMSAKKEFLKSSNDFLAFKVLSERPKIKDLFGITNE